MHVAYAVLMHANADMTIIDFAAQFSLYKITFLFRIGGVFANTRIAC
jgi:hypothetical protein